MDEWSLGRAWRVAATASVIVAVGLAVYLWAWDAFARSGWERFERNAEPWVAVGTILLALATFVLARRSKEQSAAALQEVELARRALETNARPMLVDAPHGVFWEMDGDERRDRGRVRVSSGNFTTQYEAVGALNCVVPLQNVGVGLALIQRFEMRGLTRGVTWRHVASQSVVPPGELVTLSFEAEIDPGDADEMSFGLKQDDFELELDVWYSDIAGEQRSRTRVYIEGHRGWFRPTWATLYRGDDTEPYVELRREVIAVSVGDS